VTVVRKRRSSLWIARINAGARSTIRPTAVSLPEKKRLSIDRQLADLAVNGKSSVCCDCRESESSTGLFVSTITGSPGAPVITRGRAQALPFRI
jgi:hypothetical protein